MKAKIITIMMLIVSISLLNAQPLLQNTNNQTSTVGQQLQNIFQYVDLSQVSTHLLMDHGFECIPLENYNGAITTTNKTNFLTFNKIYYSVYSAATSASYLITEPHAAYQTAAASVTDQGTIPVFIEFFRYNRLSPTAITENLMYISGTQLHDVAGRTQSPYLLKTVFAATPAINKSSVSDVTFSLPSSYFFNNTGKTLSSIVIDFDDGAGTRTLSLGSNVTISYSGTGDKNIHIKCTFTDGTIMEAVSPFKVYVNALRYNDPHRIHVNADRAHQAQYGSADVTFAYACGNTKLVKPLIIVDGWDPPQFDDLQQVHYSIFRDKLDLAPNNLYDELEIAGYDLVYVDFTNGADYIQRNAYVLEKIIGIVNEMKEANRSTAQNMVIGFSMGGLVARFALRDMELNGLNHDTRKFITFDTPHQGANVPLGFQQMVKTLYETEFDYGLYTLRVKDLMPELETAVAILKNPASQQMLVYQAFEDGYPVRADFLAEAAMADMPQSTINYAISNGSQIAEGQPFDEHDKLLQISANNDIIVPIWGMAIAAHFGANVFAEIDVWSVPDNPSFYKSLYYQHLFATVFWLPVVYSDVIIGIKDTDPYDNAPGGYQDASLFSGDVDFNNLPADITFHETKFDFVPTVSSLNISSPQNQDLFYNINNNSNVVNRFIEYTAPSTLISAPNIYNEVHINFDGNNSNFIKEKLIDEEFDNSLANINTLSNRTYNFGKTSSIRTNDRITESLTLDNGASLLVNANDGLTYTDLGLAHPSYGSKFTVYVVPDCSLNVTTVEVKGGSTIKVGDNSTSNKGKLIFTSGTTLKLRTGSSLVIEDGSELQIEPGAHFICEPGVQIILNGENALLDVQDLTTSISIGTGESFNVSSGPGGGGTMKLAGGDFNLHSGSTFYNIDCKLILANPVSFEVEPNVTLWLIGDKSFTDVQNLNTVITIPNGAFMNVMGFSGAKQGELYLHGGIFNINTGGMLLSQQCNIHLGAEMDLNYKAGAIIQLDGDDAVLDIGGDLFLKQGSIFKFIWNSIDFNSGYIRMSALPDWNVLGRKNIWCETNCKFELKGAGKHDKILEIAQETLYDPTCAGNSHGNLDLFRIVAGKVEFAGGAALGYPDGARLALKGPVWLSNVHFVNRDNDSWRGVVLFGHADVLITGNKFQGADCGILAALYGGNRLSISSCNFYGCAVGLRKLYGGVDLRSSVFNLCEYGFKGQGGTWTDNLSNNEFYQNGYGIECQLGATTAEINLVGNYIHHNSYPLIIDGGNVNARCNTITENEFFALHLLSHGNLNMNSTRGAGYNNLSNNNLIGDESISATLLLDGGDILDMQDGYNDLTPFPGFCNDASPWCSTACRSVFGAMWNSVATLYSPPCASPNNAVLGADRNKWTNNTPIPFTYCFDNLRSADPACTTSVHAEPMPFDIQDAYPIGQLPACGEYDGGTGIGHRNVLMNCDSCEQVPVSINSTTRLDSAIRKGIALLDTSIAQYTQAIDLFSYVLNYRLATPDVEGETYLTGLAYIYLNTAYSRAIDGKQISVVPPFITIDANAKKVLDIQKERIAQAITDSVYHTRFYLSIDLANSFRMLQMRDSSIAIYNYMQTFADSADLPLVQKWVCFVKAENDYVKGVKSFDEFLIATSECFPYQEDEGRFASGYQGPLTPEKQNKLKKAIDVYPNPATNQMMISLKNFGSDNKYILIYDCLGNVVKDFGNTAKNEIEENVSNYPKGIYLVKAVSGKQVLTTMFVVN